MGRWLAGDELGGGIPWERLSAHRVGSQPGEPGGQQSEPQEFHLSASGPNCAEGRGRHESERARDPRSLRAACCEPEGANLRQYCICRTFAGLHRCSSVSWHVLTPLAQAPPEPTYGYEVVSVKKSGLRRRVKAYESARVLCRGGLRSSNTTLMVLLTFAYDVRDYQILEAPGWSKTEGFDVSFTPEKPETPLKPVRKWTRSRWRR